ncbi:MAG: methyltransferase [Acidobacteriota bacterium]|jgi:protein-S-isoprenylcysteine O-methyltransferase Ste14
MGAIVDSVRYWLAVVLVASMPVGLVYWFIVHPFIAFWRRVGVVKTYVVLSIVGVAMIAGLFLVRDALLGTDFGTNWWLIGLALAVEAVAVVLYLQRKKHLDNKQLSGLQELDPSREDNRLLTQGPYGVIRHPRYVEVVLAVLAYALFSNYLGAYGIWVLTVVCIVLIVPLEERELEERFGEEYRRYRERVPAFFWWTRPKPPSGSRPPE